MAISHAHLEFSTLCILGPPAEATGKTGDGQTKPSIPQRLIENVKKGLLYAIMVLVLDAAALGIDSLILVRNMFHYLTLLTLGEAALLFLVGGGLDIGSSLAFNRLMDYMSKKNTAWSMDEHRKAQWKAAPIIVAGILLLGISYALAYPLN